MITLSIPGFSKDEIQLQHLVLDFNGTLAIDGKLINGVKEALLQLSQKMQLHVLTGNTFGTAANELKDIPCKLVLLPETDQSYEKGKYTTSLNKENVISIGNGNNDRLMLQLSAIGIIVLQREGAAINSLTNADVVCNDILSAFELIQNPLRLKATLRQ